MKLSYDPDKRGLDFDDAARVFDRDTLDAVDDRNDYGERRFISIGALDDLVVAIVWTQRDTVRRIISMRKASRDERNDYWARMGGSG